MNSSPITTRHVVRKRGVICRRIAERNVNQPTTVQRTAVPGNSTAVNRKFTNIPNATAVAAGRVVRNRHTLQQQRAVRVDSAAAVLRRVPGDDNVHEPQITRVANPTTVLTADNRTAGDRQTMKFGRHTTKDLEDPFQAVSIDDRLAGPRPNNGKPLSDVEVPVDRIVVPNAGQAQGVRSGWDRNRIVPRQQVRLLDGSSQSDLFPWSREVHINIAVTQRSGVTKVLGAVDDNDCVCDPDITGVHNKRVASAVKHIRILRLQHQAVRSIDAGNTGQVQPVLVTGNGRQRHIGHVQQQPVATQFKIADVDPRDIQRRTIRRVRKEYCHVAHSRDPGIRCDVYDIGVRTSIPLHPTVGRIKLNQVANRVTDPATTRHQCQRVVAVNVRNR